MSPEMLVQYGIENSSPHSSQMQCLQEAFPFLFESSQAHSSGSSATLIQGVSSLELVFSINTLTDDPRDVFR